MARVKKTHGIKKRWALGILISTLVLSACQTAPTSSHTSAAIPQSSQSSRSDTNAPAAYNADGSVVSPAPTDQTDAANDPAPQPLPSDGQNPLTRPVPAQSLPTLPNRAQPVITPAESVDNLPEPSRASDAINDPALPSHSDLLERARQNSKQQNRKSASDNSAPPAYQSLMQSGIRQLKSGDVSGAQSSFTRAQRLSPKSSAVYFYLSQVALQKNQPRKAEAMARRGLSVADDANQRRSLWQLVLKSAQAQNNARVIREAKQALR